MSEQIESFIDSQIDKLMGYCPGKYPRLNMGVPFYSQRDNYTMPGRTCNSSSNAMLLTWLRLATYREPLSSDDVYLRKVLTLGDTIDHNVQTAALKHFGWSTKWMECYDKKEQPKHVEYIDALLAAGFPVVVNIFHRGSDNSPDGGHVICLIGKRRDSNNYIAHDPYGTLASGYTNTNGAYSKITHTQFAARWQGGYRVLA
jgi:hypothetical protein